MGGDTITTMWYQITPNFMGWLGLSLWGLIFFDSATMESLLNLFVAGLKLYQVDHKL